MSSKPLVRSGRGSVGAWEVVGAREVVGACEVEGSWDVTGVWDVTVAWGTAEVAALGVLGV